MEILMFFLLSSIYKKNSNYVIYLALQFVGSISSAAPMCSFEHSYLCLNIYKLKNLHIYIHDFHVSEFILNVN